MAKGKRNNHDLLICIEQKVIQHGKDFSVLKKHFENHLTEHREDLKEKLKRHWTIVVIALAAFLTAMGSLIVGLLLFFLK